MTTIGRYAKIAARKINGYLNRRSREQKVFCIGLHKTGTTTLSDLFQKYGFSVIHETNWPNDNALIQKHDFFADGGSHFEGENEFDFERLYHSFPDAKFILQTRNTKKWIISKLKHAGWTINTEVHSNDPTKINHADWRFTTYLHVEKFIEHKQKYERRVRSFFNENGNSRFIEIDITDKRIQNKEYQRLKEFFKLKSIVDIPIPHSNKAKNKFALSDSVNAFIESKIHTSEE